jgi:hypothetical protein
VTHGGKFLTGMGVKFLNLSPEGKERIEGLCKEREKEINRILGCKKS